jgi:hypothetical protein
MGYHPPSGTRVGRSRPCRAPAGPSSGRAGPGQAAAAAPPPPPQHRRRTAAAAAAAAAAASYNQGVHTPPCLRDGRVAFPKDAEPWSRQQRSKICHPSRGQRTPNQHKSQLWNLSRPSRGAHPSRCSPYSPNGRPRHRIRDAMATDCAAISRFRRSGRPTLARPNSDLSVQHRLRAEPGARCWRRRARTRAPRDHSFCQISWSSPAPLEITCNERQCS